MTSQLGDGFRVGEHEFIGDKWWGIISENSKMAGKGMFFTCKSWAVFLLQAESVVSRVFPLSALPGKGASSPSCPVQGTLPEAQAVLLVGVGCVSRINDILGIVLIAQGLCCQMSQFSSWSLSFLMKTVP